MTQSSSRSRLHAIIHGRVQGVNFRAFVSHQAHTLGLSGWVCNRRDGTVETVAEGSEASLRAFLEKLRQGSPASEVVRVDAAWEDAAGDFGEFQIRYY